MSLSKKHPKTFPCIPQNTQKNPSFSPAWNCKQPASIAATPSLQPFREPKIDPEKSILFPAQRQKKKKKKKEKKEKRKRKLLPFSRTQSLTKLQQNTAKIPYNRHFPTNQKPQKETPQPKSTESYILFSIIPEFCTKFGQIFSPNKSKLYFSKNTPQ